MQPLAWQPHVYMLGTINTRIKAAFFGSLFLVLFYAGLAQANLLTNGDFSAGLAGWNTAFGSVETATSQGASALTFVGGAGGSAVEQKVTGLQPGQSVQLKASMRIISGTHPVYLVVNGHRLWTLSTIGREVAINYVLGPDENSVQVWLWFDGKDPAERAEVTAVEMNLVQTGNANLVVTGEKSGERIPEYWGAAASSIEGDPRQWYGAERVTHMQIGYGRELLTSQLDGPGRAYVVSTPTGRLQIIYSGNGTTVNTDIRSTGITKAKLRHYTYTIAGTPAVIETKDITDGQFQIQVQRDELTIVEVFPTVERAFRVTRPDSTGAKVGVPAAAPNYHVAMWYPTWVGEKGLTALRTYGHLIDEVNFFWYDMQAGGGIAIKGSGKEDVDALALAWQAGSLVIPTVTNGFNAALTHSVLSPVELRQRHIDNLVSLAVRNGYDGLDLDYESMAASDRELYSIFIEEVAAALHAYGKILSVTVHPKTSEPGPYSGPQSQDYTRIGRAADIVKLMIYDYSYSGGSAGPVSPIGWTDQVIGFSRRVIPAQKVMYGLPWYGYDWPNDKTKASSVDVIRARQLAGMAGAQIRRDTNEEPYFNYKDATGRQHTVYFQDGQSYAARLKMMQVKHTGILGIAHWQLGNESPEFWSVLESLRKGQL